MSDRGKPMYLKKICSLVQNRQNLVGIYIHNIKGIDLSDLDGDHKIQTKCPS